MVEQAAKRSWVQFAIITVPAIVLAGSASGWLSNSGFGNNWFDGLVKPPYMPPGWVFGVAWTCLYILLGLALAMILAEPPSDRRRTALLLFYVQLALNFAWSPIFFAGHDIRLAAIVIFVMLAIAASAGGQFFRIRPLAGMLVTPYLAWLCFAATLNTSIYTLNPDAGTSLFG
jgi:translocator protein